MKKQFSIEGFQQIKPQLQKSRSFSSIAYSRTQGIRDSQIVNLNQKLNELNRSVDFVCLRKNRLNMIQYEMEGQKTRNDPEMIQAKLRQLQNKAELHRVDLELSQIYSKKSKQKSKKITQYKSSSYMQQKKYRYKPYLNLYQEFIKEKQMEVPKFVDQQEQSVKEQFKVQEHHQGLKYFSLLRKHPRLVDFTLFKLKQKKGFMQKQMQEQKRLYFSRKIRQISQLQEFKQQKERQKVKQEVTKIQNPESVIERQITKFYSKKNPGKLTDQAKQNKRSISLMTKQKQITGLIKEQLISQEGKKRMKYRFNDLANEIAKSDRKKSVESLLPKINELFPIIQLPKLKEPSVSNQLGKSNELLKRSKFSRIKRGISSIEKHPQQQRQT